MACITTHTFNHKSLLVLLLVTLIHRIQGGGLYSPETHAQIAVCICTHNIMCQPPKPQSLMTMIHRIRANEVL